MKDRKLRERHADTIREDIKKGQFITVQPYDPRALTDCEWYLLQYPVRTPNKPGKVRRVPNGAANSISLGWSRHPPKPDIRSIEHPTAHVLCLRGI